MESFRPRLYRLAWSWCHDDHLADDLVQDAMVRALQRLDDLRDQERLEVWLIRILANLHHDHLRNRRNEVVYEDSETSGAEGPEHAVHRAGLIEQVRLGVSRLGEDQRKVLTLVDLMELSYADVAHVLEIPIGTVMSRLCRARNNLKTLLDETQSARNSIAYLRRVK